MPPSVPGILRDQHPQPAHAPGRSRVPCGAAFPAWVVAERSDWHIARAALQRPMQSEWKLARLTVDQLLKCALYIQAVAAAATTTWERAALDRLAQRRTRSGTAEKSY